MRIDLTPEQESQVIQIAAQEGRNAGDVVRDLFSRSLSQEERFIAAVKLGEADFDNGDILTHDEVGARVARLRET
jgi:predicted transcriptional regulator